MYNRDKIIQTLRDINEESKSIAPYVVIAQPRRNSKETASQNFRGHGTTNLDLMGFSHGYVDISGELVDVARNYLIDQVLESGAKYMLFIGDDTVVPWDAFSILHKTAEENPNSIVTGVYYIKCAGPMIMTRTKDNHIIIPNVDPGQLLEAWQTGMDIMLIPVEILRKLKTEEPELPFCCIANEIEDIPFIGEDNFFVYRIRKMGVKLLVNTDVQCLHMDLATGKYTAHPSVDLTKYYTNIKPTGELTLDDKKFIDHRWVSRLPGGDNNPKIQEEWLPGKGIPELIKDIKNPIGIEIGTAEGITTEYLLNTREDLTLFGIDPYQIYTDWDGKIINSPKTLVDFLKRVEPFGDRFNLIREKSDDVPDRFDDESVDFIFIDGEHTYNQLLKDCKNYYPKLKKGGFLFGHDYARIQPVNKAANEFAASVAKDIKTTQQDIWYIIK